MATLLLPFNLQSRLTAAGLCMPQRGPWICDSISKLVLPEFELIKCNRLSSNLAPTAVQNVILDCIFVALCKAGNPAAELQEEACLKDMLSGQSLLWRDAEHFGPL